jgi:hypothetical protein
MADAQGSLTFVLDENTGGLLTVMRMARVIRHESLTDLQESGIAPGTLDPLLLAKLGGLGRHLLLTRDGSMLDLLIQRGAWREAGVTLFLLGKRWGTLPLSELTRRMLFLSPDLVAQAEASAAGAAWRVSPTIPTVPSNAFRLVTGRHSGTAPLKG